MKIAFAVLIITIFTAGCVTAIQNDSPVDYDSSPSHQNTGDGQLIAVAIQETPPNATIVNHSDKRVQTNDYLRKVVREAVNESGKAIVEVPEKDVEDVKQDLETLPMYSIEESDGDKYDWGYYIQYKKTTVRVQFAILE